MNITFEEFVEGIKAAAILRGNVEDEEEEVVEPEPVVGNKKNSEREGLPN